MKIEGGDEKNMWGTLETGDGGGLPFQVTTAGEAQVVLPISKQVQVGNQVWDVVVSAKGVALSTKGGEGFAALNPLRFLEEHVAKEGVLALFGVQPGPAQPPASIAQAETRRRNRRAEAQAKVEPQLPPQATEEAPPTKPEPVAVVEPPPTAEVAQEAPRSVPVAPPAPAPVQAPAPKPPAPPAPAEHAYGPGYDTGLPAEVFELKDAASVAVALMPIAYDAVRQEFEEQGKLDDWYDVVGSSWGKQIGNWIWTRVATLPVFQTPINPKAPTMKWTEKHVATILAGKLNNYHSNEASKYQAAKA